MSLILSGTDGLSDVDGSAATPAIRGTDANTGMFFPAADTIAFAEGGVETMRITSAGDVGIGTASPQNGAGYGGLTLNGSTGGQLSFFTGGTFRSTIFNDTANLFIFNGTATGGLLFYTNSAERIRITSAGNVGIGISTPRGVFDVVGTGSSSSNNWAYISGGNVGAANPAASFGGGIAVATNYSSGNSETNLVWSQTTGAGQYFSISKWTGSAVTEQLRITSTGTLQVTGNVTAPNLQGPAFSAYMSANQSISANTLTKVDFDLELFDTNSNFDTTNNRFTPTVAGYYQMTFSTYQVNASTSGIYTHNFYKNGSLYKQTNYNTSASGPVMTNCTTLVFLNGTTDYMEAYYSTQFASTLGGAAGAPYFEFSGVLVRSA